MKALFKILFIIGLTCANANTKPNLNISQVNILQSLDIPQNFTHTSYYKDMKKSITKRQIDDFVRVLRAGYKYVPILKTSVKNSGLPDPFFYLAMVESGFSNKVVSNARAAGIWQFMAVTAQAHGLKIDKYVDERRDPIKATNAAAKYLKGLKSQFGKWYLAILAYNCGDGCLRKAIRNAGTDDLATLLDPNAKYLPDETRRFIIKILRASMIAKDSEFILSRDANILSTQGQKLTRVSVPGGTTLKQVSDSVGLSIKRLKEENTHLNYAFTPPNSKNYHIYLPESKLSIFNENFKPIQSNNKFYTYTVKKGDTLLNIAKTSGVSHKAIKEYNELQTSTININQKLIIPRSDRNKIQSYVVQNGDTLEILSKRFNVAIKDIKEANALASNDVLAIGDNIVIP